MRHSIVEVTLFCLVVLLGSVAAHAVDIDTSPAWLVYEKGKQLFDSGEYGESLFYFRKARESYGSFPEIEYWIGRVFEAEGEYDLAILQYTLALEKSDYLEIRDEVYDIHMRLAHIYFTRKLFLPYVTHLELIIERDTEAREADTALVLDRRLISRTLSERGIDKLLELYRLGDYGGLSAYHQLGVYKLRTGFVESALQLLTYSTVVTFSSVIDHLMERDPEYRFDTFSALLQLALKYDIVSDYLSRVDGFGQLYALALALRGSGEPPKIREGQQLLELTSEHDGNGYWGRRAARQLSLAFDDDFMIIY